jgi:hypothetical protein
MGACETEDYPCLLQGLAPPETSMWVFWAVAAAEAFTISRTFCAPLQCSQCGSMLCMLHMNGLPSSYRHRCSETSFSLR